MMVLGGLQSHRLSWCVSGKLSGWWYWYAGWEECFFVWTLVLHGGSDLWACGAFVWLTVCRLWFSRLDYYLRVKATVSMVWVRGVCCWLFVCLRVLFLVPGRTSCACRARIACLSWERVASWLVAAGSEKQVIAVVCGSGVGDVLIELWFLCVWLDILCE